VTLTVSAVNDAPVAITPNEVDIDENLAGATLTVIDIIDPDISDTHFLQVNDDRLEIVNGTLQLREGEFFDHELNPVVTVQITVTDSNNAQVMFPLTINVLDANDAPVVNQTLPQFVGDIGDVLTFDDTLFSDQDDDDLIFTLSLIDGSPLPEWLLFDSESRELIVLNNGPLPEELELQVTATDSSGTTDSTPLRFLYNPVEITAADSNSTEFTLNPIVDTTVDLESQSVEISSVDQNVQTENSENLTNTRDLLSENDLNSIVESTANTLIDEPVNTFRPEVLPDSTVTVENLFFNELLQTRETENEQDSIEPELGLALIEDDLKSLFQQVSFDFNYASDFLKHIDDAKSKIQDSNIQIERIKQASFGLFTGVSIGYVVWVVRSGAIFASMLTALPAWKLMDPLPVLATFDDSANDDGESLESIVDDDVIGQ